MKSLSKRCRVGFRGFTLIEILLTVAVVGVGLIGVLYAYTAATRNAVSAERAVVASFLAREKMEEIIADRSLLGYGAVLSKEYSDGRLPSPFSAFTRSVRIIEVDPDADIGSDSFLDPLPGSGYARVTVEVGYGDGSVKLETLIADYEVP